MAAFADFLGIFGVILVSVAYFLLNLEKLSAENIYYPLLNLLGSLLIIFSLAFSWNLSAFCMEGLWAIISLFGLIKCMRRQPQT